MVKFKTLRHASKNSRVKKKHSGRLSLNSLVHKFVQVILYHILFDLYFVIDRRKLILLGRVTLAVAIGAGVIRRRRNRSLKKIRSLDKIWIHCSILFLSIIWYLLLG